METQINNLHDVWSFVATGVDSLPTTVWIVVVSLVTGMLFGALLQTYVRMGERKCRHEDDEYNVTLSQIAKSGVILERVKK